MLMMRAQYGVYDAVEKTSIGARYLFPSGYIVPVNVEIGIVEARREILLVVWHLTSVLGSSPDDLRCLEVMIEVLRPRLQREVDFHLWPL